jgi:hypothetical protein
MGKSANISKTVVVVFSARVQGTAVKWRGEFSWELKGIESSHQEAYLQVVECGKKFQAVICPRVHPNV